MLAEMTGAELSEWYEFARREPFGEERADLRAGVVAAVTANVWRGKRQEPLRPTDFLLFRRRKRLQTKAQMRDGLVALTKRLGGQVVAVAKEAVLALLEAGRRNRDRLLREAAAKAERKGA